MTVWLVWDRGGFLLGIFSVQEEAVKMEQDQPGSFIEEHQVLERYVV